MLLEFNRQGGTPVTVCIAAIYENSGVFSASDRMITAGDVQFEPPVEKVRYFTSSCLVMFAGDAALQAQIIQATQAAVSERLAALTTPRWLTIEEMAGIYKDQMSAAIFSRAARRILVPLGLTVESWLNNQRNLSPELVRDVSRELLNYDGPSMDGIVCGIDSSGPHIYTVDNNSVNCRDHVGFAAIGAGYWHANSQMMNFRHGPRASLADTLLSVFFAKKQAEIAPGVGEATDMYIATSLGSSNTLRDNVAEELENRYAEEKRRQKRVATTSRQKINVFVQGILNAPPAQTQAELPAPTEPVPPAPEPATIEGEGGEPGPAA
jgi:20S proteasome alpha/beta subunit